MNQFFLQQGSAPELNPFPHILEIGLKKNNSIQLNSFNSTISDSLRIYSIIDGKFEWIIGGLNHSLYPGDMALILPQQSFSGDQDILHIGTISWISLEVAQLDSNGIILGKWSQLSEKECEIIGKILSINKNVIFKLKDINSILETIYQELTTQEIGYGTRINQLLDHLLICLARQSTRQNNSQRDFAKTFTKLEQTLRQRLNHQWTVEEMAAIIGLGTTALTEKVKKFTGFSPLNYLINIRISEAIKLLDRQEDNVTDIALRTGFYSSQHFSTTFKKLTGYTPSEFRKRNLSNNK